VAARTQSQGITERVRWIKMLASFAEPKFADVQQTRQDFQIPEKTNPSSSSYQLSGLSINFQD